MKNATPLPSADFGALLRERGLVTSGELEEAVKRQRQAQLEGRDPLPRLGEILVEMGTLTEPQVAEVLSAQNKRILVCGACGVQVNATERPDAEAYRCARCGGALEAPATVRDVRVADSSIILVTRDPLPEEVREAMADPSRKFGKFILLGEIGRGGAAIVHRAWDTYLHQPVALKVLKPSNGPRNRRAPDLVREARSAARMRHANIVTVHEVGKIDGEYYIAMELLEGATLSERIRSARAEGKVSPFYDAPKKYLAWLRDVALAAHYAHTRPIPVVHCDLKPSNVFITAAGERACVLDFGLARELRGAEEEEPAGIVRGTPAYMAPEQAAGRPGDIDARTDVYGLGGILYELLAGRPPFTGDLFSVLHKAISSMPDRPSELVPPGRNVSVPAQLEKICLRCLEKDRPSRYSTAREMAADLERVLRGDAVERRTTRRFRKSEPSRPRRQVVVVMVALLLAAAVTAAAAVAGRPDGGPEAVDGLLASLRTEEAERVMAESEGSWVEERRVEAEWLARLKGRLAAEVNRGRRRSAALGSEVLGATNERIVLASGEREWSGLTPEEVRGLATELLGVDGAAERFGLALYCLKNKRKDEARALFESAAGGDLGPYARVYLARMQAER
jgi:hypothetical protein